MGLGYPEAVTESSRGLRSEPPETIPPCAETTPSGSKNMESLLRPRRGHACVLNDGPRVRFATLGYHLGSLRDHYENHVWRDSLVIRGVTSVQFQNSTYGSTTKPPKPSPPAAVVAPKTLLSRRPVSVLPAIVALSKAITPVSAPVVSISFPLTIGPLSSA